jgi:uncharacterized YccA/Bax inhibitor family protein
MKNQWYSETLRALTVRYAKFVVAGGGAVFAITVFGMVSGCMFLEPVPAWYAGIFLSSVCATVAAFMFMLGIQAADRELRRERDEWVEWYDWKSLPQPLPGSCMSYEEYCKPTRHKRS